MFEQEYEDRIEGLAQTFTHQNYWIKFMSPD